MNDPILTARLALHTLSLAVLEASLLEDAAEVGRLLGFPPAPEWYDARHVMQMRVEQLRRDAAIQPWLLRAVLERESGRMVGHAGFHTRPGPDYLERYAPGGVEMGYTIYPEFRRRGYAREVCGGLMAWAQREAGVTSFVLSIRPDNEPSQRIAAHFGFRKVGMEVDDIDGPEDVLVLVMNGASGERR
jgi:[ribosomal protein S5]-alanine N-acetyltransferase